MKNLLFILLANLLVINIAFAQGVSVNTTGAAADTSAMLDVSSFTKGVLVPRMTAAQKNALYQPAIGLLIFQTDSTAGFRYYNGSKWVQIINSATAAAGSNKQILYNDNGVTTGATDVYYDNANPGLGVGTPIPIGLLDVAGENAEILNPWASCMADEQIIMVNGPGPVGASFAYYKSTVLWTKLNVNFYNWGTSARLEIYQGGLNIPIGDLLYSQDNIDPSSIITFTTPLRLENGEHYTFLIYFNGINMTYYASLSDGYTYTEEYGHTDRDLDYDIYTKSFTPYLSVSASGDVGIGTTAPAAKLDVNGVTKTTGLQLTSGADAGLILQSDVDGNAGWVLPTTINTGDWTRNGSLLYSYNTTDLIGIGLTDPVNKLDVEGGAVVGATYSGTNTAPTNGLLVEGNVGIGVTSPGMLLDVNNRIRLRQNGTNTAGIWLYQNTPAIDKVFIGMNNDTTVGFWGDGGAGWNFNMNTRTGNVGIGTSIPKNKLDIEGPTVIGTNYSGTITAPTNGLLVEGTVGIGTNAPSSSAALDVSSTTKGFLPPRMTNAQILAITPVAGLIIYNTTNNVPIYYNGTEWVKMDGTSFLYISKPYQGGIIAYIDGTGLHGLIAAPGDQSSGIQWYNGTDILCGTNVAYGTGQANTTEIVADQGAGSYAAQICNDLVLGGYSDWYLPSKDELYLLTQAQTEIGLSENNRYWSSSEVSYNGVWIYWGEGTSDQYNKHTTIPNVRAVRSF